MALRLNGSTSGYVELDAPAVAGTTALTLPATAGTVATQAYADTAVANRTFDSSVFVNTSNGYGSTNDKIRRFTNIVRNSGSDITYADSATLGASFTINTTGMYSISFGDQFSSIAWTGLSLNSTQLTSDISTINVANILSTSYTPAANTTAVSTFSGYLTAGDVVRAHTGGTASGNNPQLAMFAIARVG